MSSDGITIIKFWWTTAWRFLTSIVIPGTKNLTPLALIFFVAFTGLAIKFIINLFGLGSMSESAYVLARGVGGARKAMNNRTDSATSRMNSSADILNRKG